MSAAVLSASVVGLIGGAFMLSPWLAVMVASTGAGAWALTRDAGSA